MPFPTQRSFTVNSANQEHHQLPPPTLPPCRKINMGCGLTKPTKLSADLAEVDGKKEAPRTEGKMLPEELLASIASIERSKNLRVNNFYLETFYSSNQVFNR